MSLFRLLWLRRWIQKRTSPIPEHKAFKWKNRLSIIYALIAWNAFGFVLYAVYKGKADWVTFYGFRSKEEAEMSSGRQWAKTLGIKNAEVYRLSGGRVQKYNTQEDPKTTTDSENQQPDAPS